MSVIESYYKWKNMLSNGNQECTSNRHFVKPTSENCSVCVYRVEETELEAMRNLGCDVVQPIHIQMSL